MKTIKIFCVGLAVLIGLSGCSSSWLDNELTGSTITTDEFGQMSNTIEGSVLGLYSMLYTNSGSGHDGFGQKAIDLTTDLLSCDMAMTANAYGWFVSAAQRQITTPGSGTNGYFWSLYYTIIMNANATIARMNVYRENFTAEDKNLYAQALSMRAYAYYNIGNLWSPGNFDSQENLSYGGSGKDYMTAPLYLEGDTVTQDMYNAGLGTVVGATLEMPLVTRDEIYLQAINDLEMAIELFDEAAALDVPARTSKLFINADLARALLAYAYLQRPTSGTSDDDKIEMYTKAYELADSVIAGGNFEILDYESVLTTGFTNVDNPSWMWGLNVTMENTTSLASWWGHMDVHTYSYAYAGAYKAIDDALYEEIPETDIRKQWWNDKQVGQLIPDWKFYDLKRGVKADEIDRRWLNDVVYMRIEEMYLVGAEAALRAGKLDGARRLLKVLLSERDKNMADRVDGMSEAELMSQLKYNWRVEMWGEGRGLITFKRFGDVKTAGGNHFASTVKKAQIKPTDPECIFALPYSEYTNNNAITPIK